MGRILPPAKRLRVVMHCIFDEALFAKSLKSAAAGI